MSSGNAENERLRSSTSWGHLPAEMKAIVVGYMDLETALNFRQCDFTSTQIVQKFSKFDVSIRVEHSKVYHRMAIELSEFGNPMSDPMMYWEVSSKGSDESEVEQKDKNFNTFFYKEFLDQKYWNTGFSIVGRLMNDPMFNVKKLELRLFNFNEKINFGRQIESIDQLNLVDCCMSRPIWSLFSCFCQPPNRTNVNQSPHQPLQYFPSTSYHGKECLFELSMIVESTDYPFHGNKEFRDKDGYLTAKGFNQFLKIILTNTRPAREGSIQRFIVYKGFMEQIDVVGDGMRRIGDPNSDIMFSFIMPNIRSTIEVEFSDHYTSGLVHSRD